MLPETLSAEDLAWLAGFFEGEGYVGIRYQSNNAYVLAVGLSSTDPEPVDLLHGMWGGHVYHGQKAAIYRPYVQWSIFARRASAFLADIRPYVRVERVVTKIDVGLHFQAQKTHPSRQDAPYVALQPVYYDVMRRLNLRGDKTIDPLMRRMFGEAVAALG